jgi:site-specific recombinase XerD
MVEFAEAHRQWQAHLDTLGATTPRTRGNYAYAVRAVAKRVPLLGPPADVRAALQQVRAELQERVQAGEASRSLIRLTVAALRSFYSTLVALGTYPENPAADLSSTSVPDGVPRPLAQTEVNKLFTAIDPSTAEGLQDLAMVWLYYHSLRNSEVAELRVHHVQYSPGDETFLLRFPAKGGKTRVVTLIPEAAEPLALHLLRHFELPTPEGVSPLEALDRALNGPLAEERGPVFWHHGKPMTRRAANRRFAALREAAQLGAHVVPHALRHTCATNLLNADVDIRTVQEILGHSSLRQTQVYTAVLTSKKRQAMGRLPIPGGAVHGSP